jgi:copper chaperone CopZ
MTAREKLTFAVTGMGCDGCVSAIENAVMPLQGVAYVGVCLSDATMTVRPGLGLDVSGIIARVAAMGYGVSAQGSSSAQIVHRACPCRDRPH